MAENDCTRNLMKPNSKKEIIVSREMGKSQILWAFQVFWLLLKNDIEDFSNFCN